MSGNGETQQAAHGGFSAETPITTIDNDAFDRSGYVKALKEAILHPLSSDCLVVGITGEWGSGKTSLKNLLKEEILREQSRNDSENAKKSLIAEFDPWLYSGRDELISMLFLDIAKGITPTKTKIKNATGNVRKYASEALETAASATESIATKSNTPFAIPNTPTDITLSIGDKALAVCFRALSDILKPDSDDIANLAKVRTKLKKTLEKKSKRVIVFIDDIDRLTDNEVCDIFRTIKMVGDLPNVTYVLMYDQEAVARSLDTLANGRGEEYLKKLVQVSLHIPEFNTDTVWDQLDKEISHIYDKWPGLYHFKTVDGEPAGFQYFIEPFIKSPRDIVRFVNTLKMEYAALREDVEFDDLVCMVSLELFKPELRQWIYNHGPELCYFEGNLDEMEFHNNITDKSIGSKSFPQADTNIPIIDTLFPKSSYSTTPPPASNTIYKAINFYKYFYFSEPTYDVNESEYQTFILDNKYGLLPIDKRQKILQSPLLPSKVNKYLSPIYNKQQIENLITHMVDTSDSIDTLTSYRPLINIIDTLLMKYNSNLVATIDCIGNTLLANMFISPIDEEATRNITNFNPAFILKCNNSIAALVGATYLSSTLQKAVKRNQYKTHTSLPHSNKTPLTLNEDEKPAFSNRLLLLQECIRHYILGASNLHLETCSSSSLEILFKLLSIAFTPSHTKGSLTQIYAGMKYHINNNDSYNLLVCSNIYLDDYAAISNPYSLVSPSELLSTLQATHNYFNGLNIKGIAKYAENISNLSMRNKIQSYI